MIRYGGLYACHRESDKKLNHAISKEKHLFFLSYLEWRKCIFSSFGYDPLKCPECGTTMLFLELYYNHKRVPLDLLKQLDEDDMMTIIPLLKHLSNKEK